MKIAIVEDNKILGEALEDYLKSNGMRVVRYQNGTDALDQIINKKKVPELILMDVNLPDASGIDLTQEIKEVYPDLDIIIQTVLENSDTILNAIKAGASGYLLKTADMNEVMSAIKTVKEGGSFLTGRVAKKILTEFSNKPAKAPAAKPIDEEYGLSKRETEILNELVKGKSSKEIAAMYDLSTFTVSNHIRKIYHKLQVSTKSEAVSKILRADQG